ncbi:MAG: hypothetical protein IJ155_10590 [Prevotella sp.]|nr:hypothetical protein [Prevotella sp.]
MMLKEGDTTIKAYSVEECRKLAEIAKAIRKPSKKSLKVGPIEITGDTIATMFILCCLGVFSWYAYNWVLSIFKENGGERPPSTQGTDNEQTFSPKLESLNETILNQKRSKHKKKILAGGIVRRNGINVLVSNTGNGKSILSDQIGIEAASCIPTALVENANSPGSPIDTLLLDTELEDEDIVERYGQYDYLYPENFKRIANCWFDDENEFLDYIEDDVLSLEHEKFYIFDNLASLIPSLSAQAN